MSTLCAQSIPTLQYSGYLEGYYADHSALLGSNTSYGLICSYPQSQRLELNHGEFELHYSGSFQINLGIQLGDYVVANYAHESGLWPTIFEASIGTELGPAWHLEAGIFPSHIGFETAIGKDNWTLTRSLLADNTPYFETGAKVVYHPESVWSATLLILNGWQQISDTNTSPAFGWQVVDQLSPQVSLNSSGFIGNEQPTGQIGRTRYFHDLFAVVTVTDAFQLAPIFDIGYQENDHQGFDRWSSGAILATYRLSPQFRLGGRLEYYEDPFGIVTSGYPQIWGQSVNLDYVVSPAILWRNEFKTFGGGINDSILTTALSWSFSNSRL